MPAYALAHLRRKHDLHPDALVYLERIQATVDPHGGRFLVHGVPVEVREGDWPGDPLRTKHFDSDVIRVEGVPSGYDPAALADALRRGALP